MSVESQSPEMWYAPKAQSTKLLQSVLLWSGKVREEWKFLKFREKSGEIIDIVKARGGGGGGTAIYGLYRYVPLWRVWFAGPSIKLHDFPCFPWPALTLQNKISTLGCTPCDALVRPKDLIYTNSMIYKVAHKQCDKFMYSLEKGKNY